MLLPINKRKTNCPDVKNSYMNGINPTQDTIDDLVNTFEDNFGYKEVYINLDFTKKYKAIIYEGNHKDELTPYKKIHCYPYETEVFRIGQYITYFDAYGNECTSLMMSLDKQEKETLIGRINECKNILNYVDEYGKVIPYPCAFNRNIQRTDFFYNNSVNVLDGRDEIFVQYNEDTKNIKENDTFIFDGQTYKITNIGKHNRNDYKDKNSNTILRLYAIRTDNANEDDLENDITKPNNIYSINVQEDIICKENSDGKFEYSVYKNNEIVQEEVVISSSNSDILTVDNLGNWKAISDGECDVTVSLVNNENIKETIHVVVEKVIINIAEIRITPNIDKLLEGEKQVFTCGKYVNGELTDQILTITNESTAPKLYYTLKIKDNTFTLTNKKECTKGDIIIKVIDTEENELIKKISLDGLW